MARPVIHLRPWQAGDETAFAMRPDMAAEHAALVWDWANGPPGPTWALVRYPGQVIGVGGGWPVPAAPHVFQVWCLLSELGSRDWSPAIECAAIVLGRLEREHGARWITALVREGFEAGQRTLEGLGFELQPVEVTAWPGYRLMARES